MWREKNDKIGKATRQTGEISIIIVHSNQKHKVKKCGSNLWRLGPVMTINHQIGKSKWRKHELKWGTQVYSFQIGWTLTRVTENRLSFMNSFLKMTPKLQKKNLYNNTMYDKILYLNTEQWTSQHRTKIPFISLRNLYTWQTVIKLWHFTYINPRLSIFKWNHVMCSHVRQKLKGCGRVKWSLYDLYPGIVLIWRTALIDIIVMEKAQCSSQWPGHRLIA